MKRLIYALILLLVVVSGLVYANRSIRKEKPEKSTPKPTCAPEMKTEREKWLASPDGVKFTQWEESLAGKKVLAGVTKISKQVEDSSDMEAVITDLSLPPGSRLGFGVMARIDGEDYILSFGLEEAGEFQQLRGLKVNDKIIIRSHSVTFAPKYAYPIVRGDYIEKERKIIYKRPPFKGGC